MEEEKEEKRINQCDVFDTAKLIDQTDILSRRRYRQELKDLLLEASARMRLGEDELQDMYADFGWAVIKKMAAEEAKVEILYWPDEAERKENHGRAQDDIYATGDNGTLGSG